MKVLDLSFPDPLINLEYDEEILVCADRDGGPEILRFWESPGVFVVLGRTGNSGEDVVEQAVRKDNVPVLRRSSGGGTVVQGPGCLNFALVLDRERRPQLRSISESYRSILELALKGLSTLGVAGEFRPICDLVAMPGELKFSGNAQRRGKRFILHHGTILYSFDLELIGRYLRMPRRMPDYRRSREHSGFVGNISASREDLVRALSAVFAPECSAGPA